MRKIPTTIYLGAAQRARLDLLCAKTKVPLACFVREGIDEILRRDKEGHLEAQLNLFPEVK